MLTKQEMLLGRGAQAESRRVREPRRTALPCGSQSEEPKLLQFVTRKTPFCKVPGKEPLEMP